ncbi:MAG: glycosyltransferase family 4 protein [Verrucomicrobia bacterium]|jgi:glycosyltransferase involved in cell wall biosynthesis|nr:glycosyltransferase family 4 protein [Verrucomicrobiota bacterium]
MPKPPLTVAWCSFFPVEWLSEVPAEVATLPRAHPATWQRVLLAQLEQYPNLHLHILVLRKQFPRSFSFQRRGVTFHLLKTLGGCRAPSLFWVDTLLIRRALRAVRPHVLHAWGTEQGAALVAARLGIPHLVSLQGLYTWCKELGLANWHEHLAAWVEKRVLPRAPLITAESTFSANYARRAFAPAPVEHIDYVPDWSFHRVVRTPRLSPRRFLFIGRFDTRKGADVMLRALNRLMLELEFELVIVGPPKEPLYKNMLREVSPMLWHRVVFRERLASSQIMEELAQAVLLICPTLMDTGPVSVKESVVAGVPVVASAVGGRLRYSR